MRFTARWNGVLKIPDTDKTGTLELWVKELIDECMASVEERALMYTRASAYYYSGTYDSRAAIYNKTKPFIDKLSGFLMQPTDVRFQIVFDSGEPDDVLQRAQLVSEKLTADFRETDSDITFAEALTWSMVNGCYLLKHYPHDAGFKLAAVHPQNFGVLGETILDLNEQEAFCHVTYPTISRLRTILAEHPRRKAILERISESRPTQQDEEQPSYFHQMVVGGLNPLGDPGGAPRSEAAGIVNVFPVPTPWQPNRRVTPTVKLCELWVKDRDRDDYTTIQVVYPDIIIEGDATRRNVSRVPGHSSFIKIQPQATPGYFWGRSYISDVQMLQDVINKRLRDLKVMWDRNVNAPQVFSGFTSITEEQYYKIISEGGFINDPNPNAKAQKLIEPPPPQYMEELQFLFQLFDEAGGFSPVMSGQGEPGVRAGIHAQTLVRTSSPRLIDQAARVERQLAESGYLSLRIMQAMDALIYSTDNGVEFTLKDLPDNFQVQVDSHSASPAFAEDNRQVAIALARAGAIDAEDLIHMLHPPGAELLLARLRQRQKQQAKAAQAQEQKEMLRDVLQLPSRGKGGQRGRRPKAAGGG
jgi:hypothetical protein